MHVQIRTFALRQECSNLSPAVVEKSDDTHFCTPLCSCSPQNHKINAPHTIQHCPFFAAERKHLINKFQSITNLEFTDFKDLIGGNPDIPKILYIQIYKAVYRYILLLKKNHNLNI